MKNFLSRFLTWQLLIGIIAGGIAGYAYYHFIGCNTNSCAITSDPVNSTLWGVLFGGVLLFKDKKTKGKKDETSPQNPQNES